MLQEYVSAAFLIFMAELGDKTQILALTFAVRYSVRSVLGGVFLGSLANHGIAVLVGAYLAHALPVTGLQIAAGFLFLGFALWTLRDAGEDEGVETEKKKRWGPLLTVALAFFLGELGDKTQLTAITLAASSQLPWAVLAGTVTGMVLTSGMGIWVGARLGRRVPEEPMKLASAAIFTFFGLATLGLRLPATWLQPLYVIPVALLYAAITYRLAAPIWQQWRTGGRPTTAYRRAAERLYEQLQSINELVHDLCPGSAHCQGCQGIHCGIGAVKKDLDTILAEHALGDAIEADPQDITAGKRELEPDPMARALIEILRSAAMYAADDPAAVLLYQTRRRLEIAYFGIALKFAGNADQYMETISQHDSALASLMKELWAAENRKGA